MSLLDSFFNKGFKAAKCKTLLKLTIPRIKLLRNRRELQIKQMRKDIANLLETGQEATARIRVEHIIREENMMAAQEIIELFCELISVRLPIIETQRECPLDLKEAISSVCFAAPRCADLPELLQVQMAFAAKYGKEFVAAATELLPDCGVNRQMIELLSVSAPSAQKKLKLLKEIAEEHGVDWDPAASETELFKSHEDLLNGPTQFVSGSMVPLPEEKHVEVQSAPIHGSGDVHLSDSDSTLEMLAFPEVPKAVPMASTNYASAKEDEVPHPPIPSAPHQVLEQETLTFRNPSVENPTPVYHQSKDSEDKLISQHNTSFENPVPAHDPSRVPDDTWISSQNAGVEDAAPTQLSLKDPEATFPLVGKNLESHKEKEKQFVPFISPPSLSSEFSLGKETRPPPSQPLPMLESETNMDLQDIVLAAQQAAETAERAAAAARSAASLAQLRISELSSKRKNGQPPDSISENPFGLDDFNPVLTRSNRDKLNLDHQKSSGDSDEIVNTSQRQSDPVEDNQAPINVSSTFPKFDSVDRLSSSSSFGDNAWDRESSFHQPQRLPSTDDELDFSYPNLFRSGGRSFNETSRSNT